MKRSILLIAIGGLLSLSIAIIGYMNRESGDPALAPFVLGRPAHPIVFTSRTEPSAFRAASQRGNYGPDGDGLRLPGVAQWQASEGRLRVLSPSGLVRELTWEKPLPDGGTLIDVMSPNISPDGRTIVFAGRRADAHGGRFRIYSVGVDGSGLQPLTGDGDDRGCKVVPPARFLADGQIATAEERCRIDFDDIDPALLPGNVLVFASSRMPDLGGIDRRATQIWMREPKQAPRMMSANRANDRWPFIAVDRSILFSLWSRQDEVIADDGSGLARYSPPRPGLTSPANRWLGAALTPTGEQFTQIAKLPEPVWRPRPLANGRIAFMTLPTGTPTPFSTDNEHPEKGVLAVAQTDLGRVASAPSALSHDSVLPASDSPHLLWAPHQTSDGRQWSFATPIASPPNAVILSAAPIQEGRIAPVSYGLYAIPQDNWSADRTGTADMLPLFDDPMMVDAEPVCVYPRPVPEGAVIGPEAWPATETKTLKLANGAEYTGLAAKLHNAGLFSSETTKFPGQTPQGGNGLLFPPFQRDGIASIAIYASHRDRFDDPDRPVIRGELEKAIVAPIRTESAGGFEIVIPAGGSPTLLVGLDANGKVASVEGAADGKGHRPRFYAFAGDHVSGSRPGGYHFCTGCHTGHTFNPSDVRERVK